MRRSLEFISPKTKGDPARAHATRRMIRHRAEFGFAGRAKAFDVADKSLAFRKLSAKRLIHKVLHACKSSPPSACNSSSIRPTQIE